MTVTVGVATCEASLQGHHRCCTVIPLLTEHIVPRKNILGRRLCDTYVPVCYVKGKCIT